MCRLSVIRSRSPVLIADIVTRPKQSIIYQSFDAKERLYHPDPKWSYEKSSLNGDGFGIGWYPTEIALVPDDTPCVFASLSPAWNNDNLRRISEKVASKLIFAHIRAAGPGSTAPSESHCHPYRVGKLLFMHNGCIGEWERLRLHLLDLLSGWAKDWVFCQGPIDSILIFGLFLSLLPEGPDADYSAKVLKDTLSKSMALVRRALEAHGCKEVSLMNCVISDGQTVVASRISFVPDGDTYIVPREFDAPGCSLYFASGAEWTNDPDDSPGCFAGQTVKDYRMRHADKKTNVVVLTSEPLTRSEVDWIPVPNGHFITITQSLDVLMNEFVAPDEIMTLPASSVAAFREAATHYLARVVGPAPKPCSDFDKKRRPSSRLRHASAESIAVQDAIEEDKVSRLLSMDSIGRHNFSVMASASICISLPIASFQYVPSSRRIHDGMVTLTLVCLGHEDGSIMVWDLECRTLLQVFQGHACAVFALAPFVATKPDKEPAVLLFSGSGDTTVAIWDLRPVLKRQLTCCKSSTHCESGPSAVLRFNPIQGNILSLVVSADREEGPPLETPSMNVYMRSLSQKMQHLGGADLLRSVKLVMGCQNSTVFQWEVGGLVARVVESKHSRTVLATYHVHEGRMKTVPPLDELAAPVAEIVPYRPGLNHTGFVDCLLCLDSIMASGSGDGGILLWENGVVYAVLCGHTGGVLCLGGSSKDNTMYSGSRDQTIREWDVCSRVCVWTLAGHKGDVLALEVTKRYIISSDSIGAINVWQRTTRSRIATLDLHPSRFPPPQSVNTLSVEMSVSDSKRHSTHINITAGTSSGYTALWNLNCDPSNPKNSRCFCKSSRNQESCFLEDSLMDVSPSRDGSTIDPLEVESMLKVLVALPSVSGVPEFRKDCIATAKLLCRFIERLGGIAFMSQSDPNNNPVVLGRIGQDCSKPTVVFYAHYDVVPAGEKWLTAPFELTLSNGSMFGRGTNDNKGPIVAQILAVKAVLQHCKELGVVLPVNIAWVIEGEEENGSHGFREALTLGKDIINGATCVVCCNSSTICDSPGLVYGMRGVLDLLLTIDIPDSEDVVGFQSGLEGGRVSEPLLEGMKLVSSLVDSEGGIMVPGFYDAVTLPRGLAGDRCSRCANHRRCEHNLYHKCLQEAKAADSQVTMEDLQQKWSRPCLNVTGVRSSIPEGGMHVIARSASVSVSIRCVPDQDMDTIEAMVRRHVEFKFKGLGSVNQLSVKTVRKHKWWKADFESDIYKCAATSIESVYGCQPLLQREGGTMPGLAIMQEILNVPCVMLPFCGPGNNAHLPNENVKMSGLVHGATVLKELLVRFPMQRQAEPTCL